MAGPELDFAIENIVGSFEIAIPARSAPPVLSEGPYALAWSRWGLRKCLQGHSEAPRALESASGNAFSVASEPQMQSKVLLGPAPELPDAPKCCSGLLRSGLCSQRRCSDKLQSAQNPCWTELCTRISWKSVLSRLACRMRIKALLERVVRM